MNLIRIFLAGLVAMMALPAAPVAAAPAPHEVMEDAELEARARRLYGLLRCVVCQSQSLNDSNATLAEDMRGLVRERLLAGDSDAAILDHMRERYGDYVLMQPPFQANTAFLWLFPVLALVLGGIMIMIFLRRQNTLINTRLSADEEAELDRLRAEEGQE